MQYYNLSKYRLFVPRTQYTINLNGDFINEDNDTLLKSDYTQQGRKNTRLVYTPRQIRRPFRGKMRVKRKYRVFSNARYMVDSFFSLDFPYKIFYKDGDKTNTAITNIIIKDTIQRYKTEDYSPTYIDLEQFLPLIHKNYRIEKNGFISYDKVLLSLQ